MDSEIKVIPKETISPAFSFTGFDINKIWQDNVDKWATYLKISIAGIIVFILNYYSITPNNTIVDVISVIVAKLLLDIIHFWISRVDLNGKD